MKFTAKILENMNVQYVHLAAQWEHERETLLPKIEFVLKSGQYINSEPVRTFEKSIEQYLSSKHCIALNSGTDALVLALKLVGVSAGDEIITPPNSFIASTSSIVHVGATPKFVDVGQDQNIDVQLIEDAITEKTRAIMPVHLTGRPAEMPKIIEIAKRYNLAIIEDAAQAVGSSIGGRAVGTWGDIGAFSAHPFKNLNACGDAGFIVTDNDEYALRARRLRNHGLEDRNHVTEFGYVSRLDALQATILEHRLQHLADSIQKRKRIAAFYSNTIQSEEVIVSNETSIAVENTFSQFVIQAKNRNELARFLKSKGIETSINYPVPIHKQKAYIHRFPTHRNSYPITEYQSDHILSIPIHSFLTDAQVEYVAQNIDFFYKNINLNQTDN